MSFAGHGALWEVFHYYDDLLILAHDFGLCQAITDALMGHLLSRGLVLSEKSKASPQQDVVWIGKRFDLLSRRVVNTPSVQLHCLALAVLASVIPVHSKVCERVTGFFIWGMRPHLGATMALPSWYTYPWHRRRYLPRATTYMRATLGNCVLFSCFPWGPSARKPQQFLCPVLCVDAAG